MWNNNTESWKVMIKYFILSLQKYTRKHGDQGITIEPLDSCPLLNSPLSQLAYQCKLKSMQNAP
jgi:hypothetical protein